MGNAAPALNELTVWGRGWPVSTCSCHGELYTGVLQGVGCSRVWQDGASHQAINRLATWALCPGSMDPPMLGWREACNASQGPFPTPLLGLVRQLRDGEREHLSTPDSDDRGPLTGAQGAET